MSDTDCLKIAPTTELGTGENVYFITSSLAISLSTFPCSFVKNVTNIPLFLVFRITLQHLQYSVYVLRHL